MVSEIPDNLAAGIPEPEILKSYLTVSSDDVRAAISLLAYRCAGVAGRPSTLYVKNPIIISSHV